MNRSLTLTLVAIAAGLGVGTSVPTHAALASTPANPPSAVQLAPAARTCDRDHVMVIGHRGTGPGTRTLYGSPRSEDTIGAFAAAMRAGADGFETDFWPTAQNEIVSHHDPTLDRMTDGTGTIRSHTTGYVEHVHNQSGSPVPTFREVLAAMVPPNRGVDVQQEFKESQIFSDALLLEVARLDRAFLGDVDTSVLITASQVSLLKRFHVLAPDLPLGLIDRSTTGRPALSAVPAWVDVVLIDIGAADATYVRQAAAAGHQVSLRNVDTVVQMRDAVRMGATRVVTDRPEILGHAC
jgi:glycerophosphoryl diester phosphodiesterase